MSVKYGYSQYKIVREQLGVNVSLTGIYFRYGGNIYIFSYQKDGITRHTLIDTGDRRHRDSILSILAENKIDPKAIETMIITHSHPDHYGLAHILAMQSGRKSWCTPISKAPSMATAMF